MITLAKPPIKDIIQTLHIPDHFVGLTFLDWTSLHDTAAISILRLFKQAANIYDESIEHSTLFSCSFIKHYNKHVQEFWFISEEHSIKMTQITVFGVHLWHILLKFCGIIHYPYDIDIRTTDKKNKNEMIHMRKQIKIL